MYPRPENLYLQLTCNMSGYKRKLGAGPEAYSSTYAQGRKKVTRRKRTYGQYKAPRSMGGLSERKVSDIATAVYQINTTGLFTLLHAPILGSDYTQRIGRKTKLKTLYIRGFVTSEAARTSGSTGSNAAQQVRLIVLLDNQPNAAVPAVLDLLNSADPSSQLNLNNRDRFRVIKDKLYAFDPYIVQTTASQAVASASRQIYNMKVFKKMDIEVIFNATNGGTIADITSGALYMFWIGSSAPGAGIDANATISSRVRYVDN